MLKISIFILFLFVLTLLQSVTYIPQGNVYGTWNTAGSPYIIQGFIDVPQDSILTIEPGVTVKFEEFTNIEIFGTLISIGTESDSITFTSFEPEGNWECIAFQLTDSTFQDSSFLKHCIIENGTGIFGMYGGGLYIFRSSAVKLENCSIRNNSASSGGGIYCFYSSPKILYSAITNNTAWGVDADAGGGGIYLSPQSDAILMGLVVRNNHSEGPRGGGGIISYLGDPQFNDLLIDNNSAVYYGGGISISNYNGSFNDVVVTNNSSQDTGGGIQVLNCILNFNNLIIRANTSEIAGGGIDLSSPPESGGVWFNFCDISYNQAPMGGGIAIHNLHSMFNHLTCYGNIGTDGLGGALYNLMPTSDPAHTYFKNSIIWANGAFPVYNFYDGTLIIEYSDVEVEITESWFGTSCIVSDPLLVEPESGDLTLSPNSPCIDSGDPASYHDPDGSRTDMGAYMFDHGQPVSGVWDLAGSPYYIANNIYVPVDSQLVVQVGVEVIFTGYHRLDVYGRLLASGTPEDSVRFRASDPETGWQGIRFIDTDSTAQELSRIQWGILENCRSTGLGIIGNGGALTFLNSSNFELNWSMIRNCEASNGGAIYCDNSSPNLKMVVLHDNVASENGGAICQVNNSYLNIDRLTLYGNSAGNEGGGLYSDASSLYLRNSILWDNTPDQIYENTTRIFLITYCDIMGGYPGTEIIDVDPLFVDKEIGDLRLSWSNFPVQDETKSPCIDAGDPDPPHDSDGTRKDMGGLHFYQYGTDYTPGTASGTWSAAESPYLLQNDIKVDSASTLAIEPGVRIYATGLYKIEVKGRLVADGTAASPIKFGAIYPETGWIGIQFVETEGNGLDPSILDYCEFQHGNWEDDELDQYGGAILCNTASNVTISNCTIENSTGYGGGGIFLGYSDVTISNTVINNCISDREGGGIAIYLCDPQLQNVTVQNCYANDPGGGIYLYNTDPILENVVVDNNEAVWYGGGIYCTSNSNPSFNNVTVSNNFTQADHGGGIYCDDQSNPTLMNAMIITGNTCNNKGGGIYLAGTDDVTITNSTFDDNFAYYGGAIYGHYSYNFTLNNCIFSENSAYFHGAAIYSNYCQNMLISDSYFLDNVADNSGGGILSVSSIINYNGSFFSGNTAGSGGAISATSSTSNMNNVTFSENTASLEGGAIRFLNGTLTLEGITVSGNRAEKGGGLYCSNVSPVFSSDQLCDIYNNKAASGSDLYFWGTTTADLELNTFSVLQPNDYYAHPIENFNFISILNGTETQEDADLYVNSISGDDNNSGLSAGASLKTIEKALRKIIVNSRIPRTIYLSEGDYSAAFSGENFPLNAREYVTITGESSYSTILDGNDENCLLYCDSDTDVIITDLKLQNGFSQNGGAVNLVLGSEVVFENVHFRWNNATAGGAISCGSDCILTLGNSILSDNMSVNNGGAISAGSAQLDLNNVIFNSNHAGLNGGALELAYCPVVILNNIVLNGNSAVQDGNGIYFEDCDMTITNSILTDEIYEYTYSLISNNSFKAGKREVTITYSNLTGGSGTNIDVDPMFLDPEMGIFHLDPSSDCIDAGDPDAGSNDPEDPVTPGSALFPAQGDIRSDMGAYGGPAASNWNEQGIVLLQPQNIMIQISESELEISWEPVTFATSYRIYASEDPEGPYSYEISATQGVFDLSGLRLTWTCNTLDDRLFYIVKAVR